MRQRGFILLPVIIIILLIGVVGYFAYQNNQLRMNNGNLISNNKQTTQTEIYPIIEPTSSSTNDLTASWKMYSDSDFAFKYPNEWTLNKQSKGGNIFNRVVSLTDPSNGNKTGLDSISVVVYDNPKQLSLKDFEEEDAKKYSDEAPRPVFYRISGVDSKLGNSSALLLKNEDCEPGKCDAYVMSLKDNVYQILVRYDFVDKTTINQILSTFKFTQ